VQTSLYIWPLFLYSPSVEFRIAPQLSSGQAFPERPRFDVMKERSAAPV
jgi:hypothetical protein